MSVEIEVRLLRKRFSINPNTDFAAMLEQALGILQSPEASAGDCSAAAEQARKAVHGIDAQNESAPQHESQILAAMMPPGGKSIVETLDALNALDKEGEHRALTRKVAVALAEQLGARSRDAARAEAVRDEARKPFAAETKRAHEFAKRFAEYPTLAARIVSLFRSDILVANSARAPTVGCRAGHQSNNKFQRLIEAIIGQPHIPPHTRFLDLRVLVWRKRSPPFGLLTPLKNGAPDRPRSRP